MAVPSSNITITSIYSEANGGSPGSGSNINVSDLFKKSYFQGPGGSSTISYNAWGQYGNTSGADRIYGLSAKNTNNAFGDFSGLTYWYDNSTYKVAARFRNSLQAPPFPPPNAPTANDIIFELWVYDSSLTYAYIQSNTINANAVPGGYDQTFTLSQTGSQDPIIAIGYWKLRITTQGLFPGGNAFLNINGSPVFGPLGLTPNAQNDYDSNGYGTVNIASTGQGYTGLYFDVQVT